MASDTTKKPITLADIKAFASRWYIAWPARALGSGLLIAAGWLWHAWNNQQKVNQQVETLAKQNEEIVTNQKTSDARLAHVETGVAEVNGKVDTILRMNGIVRTRPMTIDPYVASRGQDGGNAQ